MTSVDSLTYCGDAHELHGSGRPLRTPAALADHVVDCFGDCPGIAVLHLDGELRLRCDIPLPDQAQEVLAEIDAAVAGHACPKRDVVLVCVELRGCQSLLKRHHDLFDRVAERFAVDGVTVHDLLVRDGRRIWSIARVRSLTTPYVPTG
jgi:hypothetical protein